MANDYLNEPNREDPGAKEMREVTNKNVPVESTGEEVETNNDPAVNNQNLTNPYIRPAYRANTNPVYSFQGIGFAISIDQAKEIAQQLAEGGSVSHAYPGIASAPLTAAIANQSGVNLTAGTVVEQVQSGSAAGLKAGDIITAIDGAKLTGESTLGEIINSPQPGDKVTLTVVSPASQGGTGAERAV